MANSYEQETESDEDCEVYFLKPVNEYNIVDKIKEANKELFAADEDTTTTDNDEQNLELMASRKVSFAANLEVYEPQSGISLKELENKLGKPDGDSTENPPENENQPQKLEVITEEEPSNDTEVERPQTPPPDAEAEIENETENCLEPQAVTETMAPDDDAIEEICEEILIMDMENDSKTDESSALPLPASAVCESPGTMQRKMLKQITFDYDEEPDNKSLTNLLISDNENDEDDDEDEEEDEDEDEEDCLHNPLDYNCNESLLEDTDNEEKLAPTHPNATTGDYFNNDDDTNNHNDDEEDDKLSIIVASYLPDDAFDCDKASLTSDNKCTHQSFRCRTRLPFSTRFSFKRKTKTSNAVASSSSCCVTSHNNNNTGRGFLPPPEVTDLKLHYKTCCEFKNAQQKLPKYTGYLSEYGLSRDQLHEREQKLQHKNRSLLEQTLKTSEDEMRKMHDNERAFTKWLKNKMRFPLNKTRNMFDVRRPFGSRKCTSVSGTALTQDGGGGDNNNMIPHTTRYRSISAKFKKK